MSANDNKTEEKLDTPHDLDMVDSSAEDEELLKSARRMRFGQYRFAVFIIFLSILLMIFSPIFNRYLEAYEAVAVTDLSGGRIKVLTPDGMPREKRVSAGMSDSIRPGVYLRKNNFSWNPEVIRESDLSEEHPKYDASRQPAHVLPGLYARFMSEWVGTVTGLEYRMLPTQGGRPGEQEIEFRMIVAFENNESVEMLVPDSLRPEWLQSLGGRRAIEELEKLLDGKQLKKKPMYWDPVLVE